MESPHNVTICSRFLSLFIFFILKDHQSSQQLASTIPRLKFPALVFLPRPAAFKQANHPLCWAKPVMTSPNSAVYRILLRFYDYDVTINCELAYKS